MVKADWWRQCDVQRVTLPIESGGRGVVSETWGVKEREELYFVCTRACVNGFVVDLASWHFPLSE